MISSVFKVIAVLLVIALLIVFVVFGIKSSRLKHIHYRVYKTTSTCEADRSIYPLTGFAREVYTIPPGKFILRGNSIRDLNPIGPTGTSKYSHIYIIYYLKDGELIELEMEDKYLDTLEYCGEISAYDFKYTDWEKNFD